MSKVVKHHVDKVKLGISMTNMKVIKEIIYWTRVIFRSLRQALTWTSILLPLQLLGAIILLFYIPIHVYLIKTSLRRRIELPYVLRWFDNADLYVGRDTSTYLKVFGTGVWGLYVWLAWRNPLNYFGYKVLGQIIPHNVLISQRLYIDGDPLRDKVGDATDCRQGF